MSWYAGDPVTRAMYEAFAIPRDVRGVRDEERVLRRRGELPDHPDEVERDEVVGVVARGLHAQPEQIAYPDLVGDHGLLRDKNRIRAGRQGGEHRGGVPALEEGIRHRRGGADGPWVDAEQVLEVVADVGKPVHHRLHRCTAATPF